MRFSHKKTGGFLSVCLQQTTKNQAIRPSGFRLHSYATLRNAFGGATILAAITTLFPADIFFFKKNQITASLLYNFVMHIKIFFFIKNKFSQIFSSFQYFLFVRCEKTSYYLCKKIKGAISDSFIKTCVFCFSLNGGFDMLNHHFTSSA